MPLPLIFTYLPVADVSWQRFDHVSPLERCIIKEVNGFLKRTCGEPSDVLKTFKCAFSDEYYYVLPKILFMDAPSINSTCPNDPYGYQVCTYFIQLPIFIINFKIVFKDGRLGFCITKVI